MDQASRPSTQKSGRLFRQEKCSQSDRGHPESTRRRPQNQDWHGKSRKDKSLSIGISFPAK